MEKKLIKSESTTNSKIEELLTKLEQSNQLIAAKLDGITKILAYDTDQYLYQFIKYVVWSENVERAIAIMATDGWKMITTIKTADENGQLANQLIFQKRAK